MAKSKRLFPRKYSSDYINTTQRPSTNLITDGPTQETAICVRKGCRAVNPRAAIVCLKCGGEVVPGGDQWFNNRSRVKPKSFMQEVPPSLGGARPKLEAKRKKQEEVLYSKWQSHHSAKWGIDKFHSIKVANTIWLYFCANTYLFVEIKDGVKRISAHYEGRMQADLALMGNRIIWVKSEPIDDLSR